MSFGMLQPGKWPVPHNPILAAGMTGMGMLQPGDFPVPQNPILAALAAPDILRPVGSPQGPKGGMHGCGGCGGGCGCSGMGSIDFSNGLTAFWTSLQDPNNGFYGIAPIYIGAVAVGAFMVLGGSGHKGRR